MAIAQQNASVEKYLQTTAGEYERETKSRHYNAVEGFGVYLMVLIVLWPIAYGLGVMPGNETIQKITVWPLILGGAYLLFVSPFIHKDSLSSWGLGGPRHTIAVVKNATGKKRLIIFGIMLALFVFLNYLNYSRWPDVVKFFGLHKSSLELQTFNTSFPGLLLVFLVGAFLSSIIILCGIRYDNFASAFVTALKIAAPLLAMIFVGAYIQRGWEAFAGFDPAKYALDVFGYLFWGYTQQLLFSAYFGTRFRKAFGPSTSKTNSLPREKRLQMAGLFGGGLALIGTPLAWGILVWMNPGEEVPMSTPVWFAGYLFPLGAMYGYFLGVDRKRLLVATLTASCFGFIHIDSYKLVMATWLLGIFMIYVFMEDKNRNLVALGFVHGLLGSTFGWLFSSNKSGALEVDYSVGPWNIDNPSGVTLVFPMICIGVYLFILAWRLSKPDEEPKPLI